MCLWVVTQNKHCARNTEQLSTHRHADKQTQTKQSGQKEKPQVWHSFVATKMTTDKHTTQALKTHNPVSYSTITFHDGSHFPLGHCKAYACFSWLFSTWLFSTVLVLYLLYRSVCFLPLSHLWCKETLFTTTDSSNHEPLVHQRLFNNYTFCWHDYSQRNNHRFHD